MNSEVSLCDIATIGAISHGEKSVNMGERRMGAHVQYFYRVVSHGRMKFTMAGDPQKFLEVALEAVRKAEPIFKKYFGKPVSIIEKQERDWVTNIDKEIEKLLIGEIRRNFPEHEIVGEEFSASLVPKGNYAWYLDPIDGTSQYIHGIPFCCISAALVDDSGPLVGVISNPETGELFHAVRGGGAFKNGKMVSVSDARYLGKS